MPHQDSKADCVHSQDSINMAVLLRYRWVPMGGLTSDTRELGQVAGIAQPGYIARSLQKGLLSLLLVWRDRCEGSTVHSPLVHACGPGSAQHPLSSTAWCLRSKYSRLDSDTHLQDPCVFCARGESCTAHSPLYTYPGPAVHNTPC